MSDFNDMFLFFAQKELDHEQALISKKKTTNIYSVERNYINSSQYHEKFEKLQVSKNLQEALYKYTGYLLEFVNNLQNSQAGQERMIALNFRTGDYITDNFARNGFIGHTSFNEAEIKIINECHDSIALIHNHSKNNRPSAQDLLTYLNNDKIKLSLIACHNGDIYAIYGVEPAFKQMYLEQLELAKQYTNDIDIAKQRTMSRIYEYNEQLSNKRKYVFIVKL